MTLASPRPGATTASRSRATTLPKRSSSMEVSSARIVPLAVRITTDWGMLRSPTRPAFAVSGEIAVSVAPVSTRKRRSVPLTRALSQKWPSPSISTRVSRPSTRCDGMSKAGSARSLPVVKRVTCAMVSSSAATRPRLPIPCSSPPSIGAERRSIPPSVVTKTARIASDSKGCSERNLSRPEKSMFAVHIRAKLAEC